MPHVSDINTVNDYDAFAKEILDLEDQYGPLPNVRLNNKGVVPANPDDPAMFATTFRCTGNKRLLRRLAQIQKQSSKSNHEGEN